tara:strand:+ start:432 stop:1442 length:1011 start_codon:yes stop_codon:yes gene_type:complete
MIKNNKVYIIAEVGVNHNGSLDLAMKSIKAAAQSGADAVKFQSFEAKEFMSNKKVNYSYNTSRGIVKESMYEMFKRLEFKKDWYIKLSNYCKKFKIDFLSSAAHIEAAVILKKIKSKAIKIASEDIINYPLLKKIAKLNKTVILSTGMANEKEIDKAVLILKKIKKKLIILHCVSLYPTSKKEVNLNRILALKKKYNVSVGFSDHTLGTEAAIAAVSLGACLIEKHFTLNSKLKGPDHFLSLNPKEFKKMVTGIRLAEKMIGTGKIKPSLKELKIRNKFRRSIVAQTVIKKGAKFNLKMLSLKRPGTGLHPIFLSKLIGKIAKRNYKVNDQIKYEN